MRTCSEPGCTKPELFGVGPENLPLCEKHFDAWLLARFVRGEPMVDVHAPTGAEGER